MSEAKVTILNGKPEDSLHRLEVSLLSMNVNDTPDKTDVEACVSTSMNGYGISVKVMLAHLVVDAAKEFGIPPVQLLLELTNYMGGIGDPLPKQELPDPIGDLIRILVSQCEDDEEDEE